MKSKIFLKRVLEKIEACDKVYKCDGVSFSGIVSDDLDKIKEDIKQELKGHKSIKPYKRYSFKGVF